MSELNKIVEILDLVIKHQAMPPQDISADSQLYDEGLGLDSLCVAELSAMLEKEYGKDPYTSGQMPQTVQDLVDFYA